MSEATGQRLGREFGLILAGRSLSGLGGYVQYLAIPLWIRQSTGSTSAGLMAFAALFLTQIVFTPVAGVIADRFDPRRVVIAADLGGFLVAGSLATTVGSDHLGWVYPHLIAQNVLSALALPAFMSLLPDVVPANRLLAANSLVTASGNGAVLLGPLLGTALLAHSSIATVVWLNAATFLVAAVCMAPRRGSSPRPPRSTAAAGGWSDVREGIGAVRTDPVLRWTMAAEAPWYLFFGAATELVLLHFGAAPATGAPGLFGLGAGAGCLVVTLALARVRRDPAPAVLFRAAVLVTAPVALAAAWSAGSANAGAFVVVTGVLLGVHGYLTTVGPSMQCQQRAEPGYRGRVTAVRRTWKALWQFAGVAAAGLAAHWIPPLTVVAAGGVLATATAAPWAWRALRADTRPPAPAEAGTPVEPAAGPVREPAR
ncbi:MFS transporter [Kitasatospora sp. NPDC051853]|uniref:MFS transporter n=1 Tax=Kitasatospora sp. NPDC051853 TaxID=3364058 RepID=UPI0037AFD4FD